MFDVSVSSSAIGMEVYSGSNNSANAAGGTAAPNTWYHVVFVVDLANSQTLQYIDGVLASTKPWPTGVGSIDNAASFGISNSPCIPATISTIAYKGLIDDIRVYTQPVNQTEVIALFNETNTVGVNEYSNNNQIAVYPNPVKNQLIIIHGELKMETINIIDVTGKLLKTVIPTTNTIDVSDLGRGMYFLQIQTENEIATSKFLKR